MRVTLIVPQIGSATPGRYLRTWQMEPLAISTLAGLTPPGCELNFFDERVEAIDFERPTDLVGITTETYNAKRTYEISAEYIRRGVPVVLGGYHPTLLPDEAVQYASAIVVGPAEDIWEALLQDAACGQLKRVYRRPAHLPMRFGIPDRSVFKGKPYFGVTCVETSRGCPLSCTYCSITTVNEGKFFRKPPEQLVQELRGSEGRYVFFIDDNFIGNINSAKETLRALIPLKIKWFSQATINMVRNRELLELMQASGCVGLLIGFESLKKETLELMDKKVNIKAGDYRAVIDTVHSYGISIYGAFVFGYDTDESEDFSQTVDLAIDAKLFMAAFNHLVPFPGTKLYDQMVAENRMAYERWWLQPEFRFGDIPFQPLSFEPRELKQLSIAARRKFYGFASIFHRFWNGKTTLQRPRMMYSYLLLNFMLRHEVLRRQGFPLGQIPETPIPLYPTANPHNLFPVLPA